MQGGRELTSKMSQDVTGLAATVVVVPIHRAGLLRPAELGLWGAGPEKGQLGSLVG